MISHKEVQELKDMSLHEAKEIDTFVSVLRVPGGWIYEIVNGNRVQNVYVPLPEGND